MKEQEYTKVLFRYHSDILDEITVETLWAKPIDSSIGLYKLYNIPFYGPLIATEDEFIAEYDESEQMLTYKETVTHSGNSIVLVLLNDETQNIDDLRSEFKALNCQSEKFNDTYFSLEIPKSVQFSEIKKRLMAYESKDIIDYAEPCLSKKHEEDIIDITH